MWPILILVIVYPLIYPIHSANIACQDIRYKYASTGSDVYNVPITPQSGKAFLENLKKSRQKNSWNQFFLWNCSCNSFKLFPNSKIDFLFWAIFEMAKNGIRSKNFREIEFWSVFPLQKLIFGHFWNCKKWNIV